MRLGLVTMRLAQGWDLEEIITRCEELGYEAVELRTTHAHGVEPTIGPEERARVRRRFERSRIRQLSLGSTCRYQDPDPEEVGRQVDLTKRWVELATDIGAVGVKVQPHGLPPDEAGIPVEQTLDQIGHALRECGEFAEGYPVSLWLEPHGPGTTHPPYIRRIMEVADHPKVGVCWNSNPADVVDGSVREYFTLLQPWIRSVHITELWNSYPWREFFSLLRQSGYDGYCLTEIPDSPEPERLMRYYAALWRELNRP